MSEHMKFSFFTNAHCTNDHGAHISIYVLYIYGVGCGNQKTFSVSTTFREGFAEDRVSSVLHQIELGLKHQTSKFGLSLIMVQSIYIRTAHFSLYDFWMWQNLYHA